MPAGRPTKYKSEFCEQLIEHMEQGYSFEAFGGVIDVAKDTLYQWLEKHEEFSDAYKIAQNKCRIFWEKAGIEGLSTKKEISEDGVVIEKNINPTMWIFNMKNRFRHEWKDKFETEHSGSIKSDPIKVEVINEDTKSELNKLNEND